MNRMSLVLKSVDPQIWKIIQKEKRRQEEGLELIASENFACRAVLEVQGSCLTNKYAEGYPGQRWYGGCTFVDEAEALAIQRAKALFGAGHVNVQPHSGTQANMAVYFTALSPGDTILAMDLACGGHLSHGHPANFSGQLYKIITYGLRRDDELIDYEQVASLASKFSPRMIIAGASAYPRLIDFVPFRKICDSVGAYLCVDMAHFAGLVATGLHPNPVGLAEFVTSTTHKTLRGPRGGFILCQERFGRKIDQAVFPGIQGGPLMHVIAAKAVAFKEAATPRFRQYQKQVVANARALAKALEGLGYRIVSGGTDTHLLLVDLCSKDLTGREAEEILGKVGITVNKNLIPFDTKAARLTSGIRLGTPAVTTRGMKTSQMEKIASLIDAAISAQGNVARLGEVKKRVQKLAERFPL